MSSEKLLERKWGNPLKQGTKSEETLRRRDKIPKQFIWNISPRNLPLSGIPPQEPALQAALHHTAHQTSAHIRGHTVGRATAHIHTLPGQQLVLEAEVCQLDGAVAVDEDVIV